MLDFDTAQARLAARAQTPTETEDLPLAKLAGRVLARDIIAVLDLPPADNSAMDGYAVRAADITQAPVTLPVQQRCFAGHTPEPLQAGQAIRLFTGSVMPAGADTVIMQEDCKEDATGVTIRISAGSGQHVRRQGSDMRQGTCVLQRGTLLGAPQIAVLAAQGMAQAPVYAALKIGILTTGDELVAPGQPLPPAAIYDSNAVMLSALCQGMGAITADVRHVRDEPAQIEQALRELAQHCDLILSIGGASVGEKDLVKPAIEALGGTLDLWRVRMKPGKPVALAELLNRPMVCLPGNPVSAFAVFALLVSPLIRGLQGRHQVFAPVQRGILRTDQVLGGSRDDFIRIQAAFQVGALPQLSVHDKQSSNALSGLAWAQGLARIPADTQQQDGDEVSWYAFSDWLI